MVILVKSQKGSNKSLPVSPSTIVAAICVLVVVRREGGINSKDSIMPEQTSSATKNLVVSSSSHLPLLDLPITPKITNSSDLMNNFFSNYATQKGGWIDVNKLSQAKDVPMLREMGPAIVGKRTRCSNPKLTTVDGQKIPTSHELKYCTWDMDHVSNFVLRNFAWEAENWGWVARSFNELGKLQGRLDSGSKGKCSWGFLDIGVNVGDYLSPLRLQLPSVPIYGIEGSPGIAAIATANFRTSVEYHVQQKTPVATSYLLPYSLMAEAQYPTVRSNGGVCFCGLPDKPSGVMNIGGLYLTASIDCPVAEAAGATTLNDAMLNAPWEGQCEAHSSDYPLIYIAKVDVEGSEFRALSSIVSWWSRQPPCYVMLEYWHRKTSYIAVAELLLDFGYDQLWIPKKKSFPPENPLWDKKSGKTAQEVLLENDQGKDYDDIIFGFSDIKGCLTR